jgi:DNA polymerase III epsilon subunit-like protein
MTPSWLYNDPPWVHVLDTETTGLPTDPTAHVIEIAVVHLRRAEDGGLLLGTSWASFIKPPVCLTDEHLETCRQISGITPEQIDSGLNAIAAGNVLIERLAERPGPILAWNLPFDRRMVRRSLFYIDETEYHDFDGDGKYGSPLHLPMLHDPLPWGGCLARHYLAVKGPVNGHFDAGGGVPEPRVVSLKQALNLEGVERVGEAHRALSDTLATAELAMKLWRGDVERWAP